TNGGSTIFSANNANSNWTIVDNPTASPISLAAASFFIQNGAVMNFGTATSVPNLTITSGSGTDNTLGNTTGTSAFNMVNGTLTLPVRFNTVTGNFNQTGGT